MSILTEIWPLTSLQWISLLASIKDPVCFSDEVMWESSLVSFDKKNTDYIKFCHILYCLRKEHSFYILLM